MNKRTKMNKRDKALRQFLSNEKSPTDRETIFKTAYNRGWEDNGRYLNNRWKDGKFKILEQSPKETNNKEIRKGMSCMGKSINRIIE